MNLDEEPKMYVNLHGLLYFEAEGQLHFSDADLDFRQSFDKDKIQNPDFVTLADLLPLKTWMQQNEE